MKERKNQTIVNYLYYNIEEMLLLYNKVKEQICSYDGLDKEEWVYLQGRLFSYYEVLSLLIDQAEVWEIDLAELGLQNLDIDDEFFILAKKRD